MIAARHAGKREGPRMPGSPLILEPTAPAGHAGRHLRQSLDRLQGKVIGFIDNSKPNFHHLVDDLAELLVSRYGAAAVVRHRKRSASVPAPPAVYADIRDRCDLVITGSGD
jgi:hypothetical protein